MRAGTILGVLLALLLAVRLWLPLVTDGDATRVGPHALGPVSPTATRTSTPAPTATATSSPSPTATVPPPTPTPTEIAPVVAALPIATATATVSPTVTIAPILTPTVAVFVLAGQSNMGLWDTIETPAAPEDDRLALAALRWTAPVPGRAPGTVRAPNGPGLAFARAIARTGRRVGLVGCAVPGTDIRSWQKGQPLYDTCLAAVRATGLPLAGIAFAQGEADAARPRANPNAAPGQWADLFARFVADWRADLGQPTLPVVYARLAHTTSEVFADNWARVQAQQDAARAPGVIEVDVEPVTLRDPVLDGVHLDQASYDLVGERLAAAYLAHHE